MNFKKSFSLLALIVALNAAPAQAGLWQDYKSAIIATGCIITAASAAFAANLWIEEKVNDRINKGLQEKQKEYTENNNKLTTITDTVISKQPATWAPWESDLSRFYEEIDYQRIPDNKKEVEVLKKSFPQIELPDQIAEPQITIGNPGIFANWRNFRNNKTIISDQHPSKEKLEILKKNINAYNNTIETIHEYINGDQIINDYDPKKASNPENIKNEEEKITIPAKAITRYIVFWNLHSTFSNIYNKYASSIQIFLKNPKDASINHLTADRKFMDGLEELKTQFGKFKQKCPPKTNNSSLDKHLENVVIDKINPGLEYMDTIRQPKEKPYYLSEPQPEIVSPQQQQPANQEGSKTEQPPAVQKQPEEHHHQPPTTTTTKKTKQSNQKTKQPSGKQQKEPKKDVCITS